MDWVQKIRNCFEVDLVYYTQHAKFELQNEEFGRIIENEIYEAICNAEVIEEYPTDEPDPKLWIDYKTRRKK